eukprot:CAMPEP_0170059662 /NCGR_PEP_ID=MMETSP0019_2-20121128/1862_1 /TAXON_ID=98059 /ORGANISM="Dinobryon sp., Strain UTEXLB2267" /LENGTH=321 /DNA_ID=CAMNT_0010264981 /DNA_START=446 /DNA_END=1409 /DNA_ORIENTATION=+
MRPPAIFVDGYNVIGMMNSLKGVSGIGNDLDAQRDSLINDLCILRGVTGWAIEVIFDAYKSPSMSSKSKSKSESIDNIMVTFTSSSETADNHIERRFAELKSSGFTNMAVVTDDLVLRAVAGSNAMGMGFLTVRMLLEEISIAYRSWEQLESDMDKEMKQRTAGGTVRLGDGINSKDSEAVMNALSKLRSDAIIATEEAKQRQRDSKQTKRNRLDTPNTGVECTSDAGSVLSELNEKALQVGQTKVIRHDSASLAVGSLRKNTLADGLSPEMQRAMAKLTAITLLLRIDPHSTADSLKKFCGFTNYDVVATSKLLDSCPVG